jgi:predicted lipid-binding transport protein (Tim44 family)
MPNDAAAVLVKLFVAYIGLCAFAAPILLGAALGGWGGALAGGLVTGIMLSAFLRSTGRRGPGPRR